MSLKGSLLLCGLLMSLEATSWAQRPALPYGLRAGRHAVAARADSAWSPVPSDSGTPPVVLLTDGRPSGPDSATAVYLASHGYVVVMGTGKRLDAQPGARIELHPAGALVRVVVAGQRFTVGVPPGTGDHIRLRATVTHALLDAALRISPPAPADLTRRLRAAGLVVHVASGER